MNSDRQERKERALAFMESFRKATALQIGAAATRGEQWAAKRASRRAVEAIGLNIAISLVRAGHLRPTHWNEFEIVT
jgi:hypothetical protein